MPGPKKRERLARRARRQQDLQAWIDAREDDYNRSLAPTRWEQVWIRISIMLWLMAQNVVQGIEALDRYDWSNLKIEKDLTKQERL